MLDKKMHRVNKKTENALIKLMKQNILKSKEQEQKRIQEDSRNVTDITIQRELKKINYLEGEYRKDLEQEDFNEEAGDGKGLLDAVNMQEKLDHLENEQSLSSSDDSM